MANVTRTNTSSHVRDMGYRPQRLGWWRPPNARLEPGSGCDGGNQRQPDSDRGGATGGAGPKRARRRGAGGGRGGWWRAGRGRGSGGGWWGEGRAGAATGGPGRRGAG